MDLIICPLGHFSLVGRTLFKWEATAMKFPVVPVSMMAEFSSFGSGLFLVVRD